MRVHSENIDFFQAMASKTRLGILELISEAPMNLREIAEKLGISTTIASRHVAQLERAGLVQCEHVPGAHGISRICSLAMRQCVLDFGGPPPSQARSYSLRVGQYTAWEAAPTCGLATREGLIGEVDDPRYFADPRRFDAEILWLGSGFVEYSVPNYLRQHERIGALSFQMEICSEAPGANEQWPSDIAFFINGVKLLTWTSPGDFGDRHGLYTPGWWMMGTQYGLLKTIRVTREGVWLDGIQESGITLSDIPIAFGVPLTLRIEASEDAAHAGGLTLFGAGFGNYAQDIQVRIEVA